MLHCSRVGAKVMANVKHRFLVLAWLLAFGLFLVGCGDNFGLREAPLTRAELDRLGLKIDVATSDMGGEPFLIITYKFVMPNRENLALQLPDNFLQKTGLHRHIRNLEVLTNGKIIDFNGRSDIKILNATPGEQVVLRYHFLRKSAHDFTPYFDRFTSPNIHHDYFQFVGSMVFLLPIALRNSAKFDLEFNWHVPPSFAIYNSHGANQLHQKVSTNYLGIFDGLFTAGENIRVNESSVRGSQVLVTFKGAFDKISDKDFSEKITSLIDVQRATFGDLNFKYFLVSIFSFRSDCQNGIRTMGTAHLSSFRAFFPSGCQLLPDAIQLISHELFHTYIGKVIMVGKERGHVDGKWFTEGFTDFYGRIFAYRAGLMNIPEYFASLNRQLTKYFSSQAFNVTHQDIIDRMYRAGSTPALESIPYQRGEIFAWRLNKEIKKRSNFKFSLDNVILDMLAEAERHGGTKNFSVGEIERIVDRYAPGIFAIEFRKISYGTTLMPPTLEDCVPQQVIHARMINSSGAEFIRQGYLYKDSQAINRYPCTLWLQGANIK